MRDPSISRILHDDQLASQIEPFDSFWEGPTNVEKGYSRLFSFYRYNYLKYLPASKESRTLVISCGPGYFVSSLARVGYTDVLGIDSDPVKIKEATSRGLPCKVDRAFRFLRNNTLPFDLIVAEQEINHLTKDELISFLQLAWDQLNPGGCLIVHSLNGANPITGAEALAQNFDHHHTLTEYSLRQVLEVSGFEEVQVFPLNLYVFFGNPLNYLAGFVHAFNTFLFRLNFLLYGKANRIFTKKIGAVAIKGFTRS